MRKTISQDLLRNIAEEFLLEGKVEKIESWGNGHINDTFAIWVINFNIEKRYILQRINKNVFKHPDQVMINIEKITSHIANKIRANNGDTERETLNIIKSKEGKPYVIDKEGEYWRIFNFIEGTTSYDLVETKEDFYKSAKAFGRFQKMLEDFPAKELYETIPNFHNTKMRYQNFLQSINNDKAGRIEEIQDEINFIKEREKEVSILLDMLEEKELPLKVTHNDTKLNNVLIDNETGEGLCVIDLDTVMPGLSAYDFGDSIRFGASTALEDECNLEKVSMDIALFEIYVKGFIEGSEGALTKNEVLMLPMGAKIITLEQAIRFLGDYIDGDTYYKISRPSHNLDRARTQIKLVADMELKWEQMQSIVKQYVD